jgi:hypothetical protein
MVALITVGLALDLGAYLRSRRATRPRHGRRRRRRRAFGRVRSGFDPTRPAGFVGITLAWVVHPVARHEDWKAELHRCSSSALPAGERAYAGVEAEPMPFSASVLRVLVASPFDTQDERELLRRVIREWNDDHTEDTGTVLLPVLWETHSVPEMGGRPQAILNRQLVENCDMLVGAFWTRLGTPTGEQPSGTVEEIRRFLGGRQAGTSLLLRSTRRSLDRRHCSV